MQVGWGYWLRTFVLPLAMSSCSLMGLDELESSPCSSDLDCERAAQRYPSRSECETMRCQQGLCGWVKGVETCNGQDDDCDGLIDEEIVVSRLDGENALPAPTDVAYASAAVPASTFIAVSMGGGASEGFVLTDTGEASPEALRYGSALAMDEQRTCPIHGPDGALPSSCNFSEVALAVDERHLVVASINTVGCADGLARIGLGALENAPFEVWLGRAARGATTEDPSHIDYGVDVDDSRCTGASRALSTSGVPGGGATRPAVASLGTPAGAAGALVLWLGASAKLRVEQRTNGCAAMYSVPVEALGVFVQEGEPNWLKGTNEGRPLHLGYSTRWSAPAVVGSPVETPGYIVAFPGEQAGRQGIQLLSVQSGQAGLRSTALDFIVDDMPDSVSLALGRTDGPAPEVGIVWSSGCGSNTRLRFAVINPLSPGLLARDAVLIDSPHLSLRPQLLYRASGFSVGDPGGGWFLLWVEASPGMAPMLQLARIGESSWVLLNKVSLRSGDVGYPVLLPSGDSSAGYARVQRYDATRSGIEALVHWCGDMP